MERAALNAVRTRLEAGWSQGALARDAQGEPIGLADQDAASWSVCGAFALAAKDGIPMDRIAGALDAFGAVTGATSLRAWNDQSDRTRAQVLAALDSALARVSSAEV
jgi:hypothetical protein